MSSETALDVDKRLKLDRNAVEEGLCAIYAHVLDIESVKSSDKFFELGGDSMRAAMVLSCIDEEFGVALPLQVMFDASSVTALAATVCERLSAECQGASLAAEAAPM